MCCTVGRCCREMISNGFRHCDILRSHNFHRVTSFQHYVVQFGKTLKWSVRSSSTGTFGQSESWSVHVSSSWKHPAVPYEVLIDPLSIPDHGIFKFKTDFSDAIDPGKTEAHGGELKVSCITSQMIIFLCLSTIQKLNLTQPCLLFLWHRCSLRHTVS